VPNFFHFLLKSTLQNAMRFLKLYLIEPLANKHTHLLYFRQIFARGSGFSTKERKGA